MKTPSLLLVAAALAAIAAAARAAEPNAEGKAPALNAKADASTVTVAEGDKPVAVYRFADVPFKPYLKELYTPGGVNVLRDAPADHLHHHALMFAIGIEKTDFWSETPECGKQVHKSLGPVKTGAAGGLASSVLTETLEWMAPNDEKPLAREQRTVEVYRGGGLGATLVTWRTTLEAGGDRPSVKLFGSHYFGLGFRFPASMDNATEFAPADPKAARDAVRGDENVFPSKWLAAIGQVDGKPVTVAMFDAPGNPRPVRWFTMTKPFAYMSATPNLYKEPMTIEAGKPLALTYGVAVWDGKVAADEIEKMCQRWLEIATPKKSTKAD